MCYTYHLHLTPHSSNRISCFTPPSLQRCTSQSGLSTLERSAPPPNPHAKEWMAECVSARSISRDFRSCLTAMFFFYLKRILHCLVCLYQHIFTETSSLHYPSFSFDHPLSGCSNASRLTNLNRMLWSRHLCRIQLSTRIETSYDREDRASTPQTPRVSSKHL
jgi:hypothetical protein